MEKKLFLAIAISLLVIFIYQHYLAVYYPSEQPSATERPPAEPRETDFAISETADAPGKPTQKTSFLAASPEDMRRVHLDTEWVNLEIVPSRAGIVSCRLVQFKDSLTGEPTPLIAAGEVTLPPCLSETMRTSDAPLQIPDFRERFVGRDKTQFISRTGALVIEKDLSATSPYSLSYITTITNDSDEGFLGELFLVTGSGIEKGPAADRRYIVCKASVSGKIESFKPQRKIDVLLERAGQISWISLQNKYFSVAFKPETPPSRMFVETHKEQNLICGLVYPIELGPGGQATLCGSAYLGPNDAGLMDRVGLGESIAESGFFGSIGALIMALVRFFVGIFHNWGVALILLAAIINIILYPLTTKKYLESARKMQALQPKMNELKEKYKDDPQKMNQAMIALYKEHKINPLGGCLPMLLQMPIFIALYRTLLRSIELKGASFLWIKDLAEPDRLFPLPFGTRFGYFNLLPVMMALAMFLQQKLSQGASGRQMDPNQRQLMIMMPLLFGFLFYNFPSGLVLYWLTSTLTMIVFSYIQNRRQQAHEAQP
ncbi:MAG: membrane protein insertase YidC [Candidatus Omnitrophica bacterium]|nr:membrane protein insertase YidC [Candidatus Omnitrophota bacterium]